jgi:hypothetical protein
LFYCSADRMLTPDLLLIQSRPRMAILGFGSN